MSDAVFASMAGVERWPGAAEPTLIGVTTPGRATSTGIVAIATGLMGVGAVMTFSATASIDRPVLGWPLWDYPAMRQLVFLFAALVAMLATALVPYRVFVGQSGRRALLLMLLALAGSALVLMPGVGYMANNARRWIPLGPESYGLRIQPSEVVKLGLPVFLAAWMGLRADVRKFWTGFLPMVLVIGAAAGLVGIEDFGTAALLAVVGGGMLMVGGARWFHLLLLVLPTVPAFGYLLVSRAHRMERLLIFLDIWRDPEGKGYQAIQSLCTIASGGWWGRGLGAGFVKGYLPAARTDFIFSVLCEELGFVGAVAVIGLLVALVWQGWKVFNRCGDPVGRLLALGITLTIGVQAVINVAVVTVSVPTKGIALPLVSAGGSGAVFLAIMVGILANIPRLRVSERS